MKKKLKIIGLIPTRLNSSRLPQKALLLIHKIPLVVHTYRRAKMSKKLDDVFICCDDKKIFKIAKKFGAKVIMTSKHHKNGTERINEAYKKLKKKYDIVIDIQGDEPLISPFHIDQVIKFHLKNLNSDIILPTLKIKVINNTNIVKVIKDKSNNVLYLSRGNIPFEFKKRVNFYNKHLSIVSFKPDSLEKFALSSKSPLEKVEDIELLRALEIGLKIKTLSLNGDSFSVDVPEDYDRASAAMINDKYFKLYK
ncbi:3-deoxy-manno-octulosonate cytidylyltransferase [Candidatus Pelagibacter sp.]|nr:3-deoxy-manno-octulosonate cytidylyltransferase [Candidatus Pelagibacter sp.]